MYTIAIYGGTFDPIHNGHLQTSVAIQAFFKFDSYRFLPCKEPTLKAQSTATTEQRVAMLELALKQYNEFSLDLREINRKTPSYMVDTLSDLREEFPEASINLVIGYDAFLNLSKWHRWEQLIKLSNLIVISRPSYTQVKLTEVLSSFILKYTTHSSEVLKGNESGYIFEFNAGNYPISSTQIRGDLINSLSIEEQVPHEVAQYIKQQELYL